MTDMISGQPDAHHRRQDAVFDRLPFEGETTAATRQAGERLVTEVVNGNANGGTEEVYEWASNGCFLLHRWDATRGECAYKGAEVLGFEPARGDYFSRFFDNAANSSECTASVEDNILVFKAPNTRATVAVTDGGANLDIACEWRDDGSDWFPMLALLASGQPRSGGS